MTSSNSTIAEIKERLNIVDVISSYIQLKKAGSNYKANCPFHHEKTPSFMVSPSRQMWHCFGCNEGGDVLSFVMKYENMDFPEALQLLADRAGVQLPKFTPANAKEEEYKSRLLRINDLAAKFYNYVLNKSKAAELARKYLQERGLTEQTLSDWQIGYAPDSYHLLEQFLTKRGFTTKELLDAGVSGKSTRGDIYDRFFGRITFPIKNYSGDIVGFTARILEKPGQPPAKTAKYINSPETQVYNKSKVIFGLNQAKQSIRKNDFAIVVEGNMDVIAAHQAGFSNAVGSSGTAFTYDQLQTLSRLTKNLKFAFDTDVAGAQATRRALDIALEQGFNVYIVKIVGAKDPDELIKKDREAFSRAVEEAPLFLDYFFEKAFEHYNPGSVEQKKKISADLISLILKLTDPLEIAHYIRELAMRLGVTEKAIYDTVAKIQANKTKPAAAKKAEAEKSNGPLLKPHSYYLERHILGYALRSPDLKRRVVQKIKPEFFDDNEVKAVFEQVLGSNAQNFDELLPALGEFEELAKMAVFMVESEQEELEGELAFEHEFQKNLKEFINNKTKLEMKKIEAEMFSAEKQKDKARLEELNRKFLELSKVLNYEE